MVFNTLKPPNGSPTLCWGYETGQYVASEKGVASVAAAYWDYETGIYIVGKSREDFFAAERKNVKQGTRSCR